MKISLVFLLAVPEILGDSYTLINKRSYLALGENNWANSPATLRLHFSTNGDDGVVFAIVNKHNRVKLRLNIYQRTLDFMVENRHVLIPGFTSRLETRRKYSVKVSQLPTALKIEVDRRAVMVAAKKFVGAWKAVVIGGYDVERSEHKYESFIGCVFLSSAKIAERGLVQTGCINACSIQSCYHGGRCHNNYDQGMCDCRGTGYIGGACEYKSLAAHFTGSDYITYNSERNPSLDWSENIVIRFKTTSDGVLMSTDFERHMLLVEVYEGSVYTMGRIAGGYFTVKLGWSLLDDQWHTYSLSCMRRNIELQLDNLYSIQALLIDATENFRMTGGEQKVYFGGSANFTNSLSKQNFIGCLQHVYFNRHDAISKALVRKDQKYKIVGELSLC